MNNDIVILIPCYDPNESIMTKFLDELKNTFTNIVIIDDGCSKKHETFMKNLSKEYHVVKHNVNLGKGRGIKNGINYILNNLKAKVIVTADCDGQHSVKDILKCSKAALKYPSAFILGCRDFNQSDVPFKSRYGNRITKNILYFFHDLKISDTQTGLRAMSYDIARKLIDIPGERYEYETNNLIATKNENIEIKEVLIDTIYIDSNATSHFNPIKDSIRIYKNFSKVFLTTALFYIFEIILLAHLINYVNIFVALLIAKLFNLLLVVLVNKNKSFILALESLLINSIILVFIKEIGINIIFFKILIDSIILIINLLFYNFKTKRID